LQAELYVSGATTHNQSESQRMNDTKQPSSPAQLRGILFRISGKIPRGYARNDGIALVLLLLAALLFRLPMLINARALNSDTAIVGLQAMRLLRGEWSWLLWGVGYQSSVDAMLAAAAFAIFGASPLVLLVVPTIAHLAVILITFAILRKRLTTGSAVACVLPLVFTPWAVNYMILWANRESCILLVFVAVWLIDGASESRRPLLRYALGCCIGALALAVDLYAILFVPGLIVLALLSVFDQASAWKRRAAACAIGAAIGAIAILACRFAPGATASQASASLEQFNANASLLWNSCLPFSLGYALLRDSDAMMRPELFRLGMPWLALQVIAGWSLLLGIAAGGTMIVSAKIPWRLRRLGAMGLITAIATIGSFLISIMPVDLWASRYLGPLFWFAPFALAPLAAWVGTRRFVTMLTPYLIVAMIGGWLSYGAAVSGPLLRVSRAAVASEEQQLRDFLRARGIHYAAADYWLAYRLTFLWHEDPIVVPLDPVRDRYSPYRDQFVAQPHSALIFDPIHAPTLPEPFESYLKANHIPYESEKIAGFEVLITDRTKPPP
jgi:hypothetical protein